MEKWTFKITVISTICPDTVSNVSRDTLVLINWFISTLGASIYIYIGKNVPVATWLRYNQIYQCQFLLVTKEIVTGTVFTSNELIFGELEL